MIAVRSCSDVDRRLKFAGGEFCWCELEFVWLLLQSDEFEMGRKTAATVICCRVAVCRPCHVWVKTVKTATTILKRLRITEGRPRAEDEFGR